MIFLFFVLQVGDIVSVIDMPSIDDTIWWRGKRGFEVSLGNMEYTVRAIKITNQYKEF